MKRYIFILFVSIFSIQLIAAPTNIRKLSIYSIMTQNNIPYCQIRRMKNKIIIIHSKYCHVCQHMMPLMRKAIKRYHVGKYVIDKDIASDSDRKSLNKKYKVDAFFLPVFIVNCHVYIGAKSTSQYNKIISNFSRHIR